MSERPMPVQNEKWSPRHQKPGSFSRPAEAPRGNVGPSAKTPEQVDAVRSDWLPNPIRQIHVEVSASNRAMEANRAALTRVRANIRQVETNIALAKQAIETARAQGLRDRVEQQKGLLAIHENRRVLLQAEMKGLSINS